MAERRPTEVISLGAQCWVAKLIRDLFPHMDGPWLVFDSIGTCPSMVAHVLVDDYRTLCDPSQYRAMGRNGGTFQNTFYEQYITNRLLMRRDRRGVRLADMFRGYVLPAFFIHNTEFGLAEMCQTLWRRGLRMSQQLEAGGLKILVWGLAIPYHHWIQHDYLQDTVEEMMVEELRVLHGCLMDSVGVHNFCLVGLLVIHGVPQTGLVADEVIPVAPIVRDMCAMMKRTGLAGC